MNALLFWMLQRMAANPESLFWEQDLIERFPIAFEEAQRDGLVRRATPAQEYDLYDRLAGPSLTIVTEEGGYVGIDEADLDELPVPLSEADLQRSYLDLDALALWLKRATGFEGNPGRVHDRLY